MQYYTSYLYTLLLTCIIIIIYYILRLEQQQQPPAKGECMREEEKTSAKSYANYNMPSPYHPKYQFPRCSLGHIQDIASTQP